MNSVREEGPVVQAISSQDSSHNTQALLQQRQVQKARDRISLQPPVSALSVCPSWKTWAPGPAFGPLWPGTIAATFWKVNEQHSLHLAWLLSQACFNFSFCQRPTGPIQLKLPGQNPLPLNLEWKQKELVPLPSAESPVSRPDAELGRETALKHNTRPETPTKIISLSGVPEDCGIKEKVSPELPHIGPSLTPTLQAGIEQGDERRTLSDCEDLEGLSSSALPTDQGGPTAQTRMTGQLVPEAPTVSETLEMSMAVAVSEVQHPPTGEGLSAAPKVPTTPRKSAVYTEPTAPKVPSASTKPATPVVPTVPNATVGQSAAPDTPTTPQTPTAQKMPPVKTPVGPQAPKVQTGPVAKAGSAAPQTPVPSKAPKASRPSRTSAAQKRSTTAGPAADEAKLLSEAQASKSSAAVPKGQGKAGRQCLQSSDTLASRSKHQCLKEGLPETWEGGQKQSPHHSQAHSTVASFQRYNEALNTPFEMNLSEEPGNPRLRRVVIDGSSVAMV